MLLSVVSLIQVVALSATGKLRVKQGKPRSQKSPNAFTPVNLYSIEEYFAFIQ